MTFRWVLTYCVTACFVCFLLRYHVVPPPNTAQKAFIERVELEEDEWFTYPDPLPKDSKIRQLEKIVNAYVSAVNYFV